MFVRSPDPRELFLSRGTVNPANPYPGQPFFRTDLGDWFYYDDTRSKWLSFATWTAHFGEPDSSGSANNLFYAAGSPGAINDQRSSGTASGHGYLIPEDATIVRFASHWATAHSRTIRLQYRDVSAAANTAAKSLVFSAQTSMSQTVNVNVDALDWLYVIVVGGATSSEGSAVAYVKKRAD